MSSTESPFVWRTNCCIKLIFTELRVRGFSKQTVVATIFSICWTTMAFLANAYTDFIDSGEPLENDILFQHIPLIQGKIENTNLADLALRMCFYMSHFRTFSLPIVMWIRSYRRCILLTGILFSMRVTVVSTVFPNPYLLCNSSTTLYGFETSLSRSVSQRHTHMSRCYVLRSCNYDDFCSALSYVDGRN